MKITFLATLFLALSAIASAEDFKGFVIDQNCASKPAMKEDAACAERCIKRGTPAVLLQADGKVLKIENQDKIKEFAGKNVTITGKLDGDKISIESVK